MTTTIRGVPVQLIVREQTGVDRLNRPIYEKRAETVDNVLIGTPDTSDVTAELNLSGKRISYILAIPKGDTHNWENADVVFWGRRYRTIGAPTQGIDDLIPLSWNKKVRVESYAENSVEP